MDRAALDAALQRRTPCGGWCPRGRRAEDGPIPGRYPLKETPSTDYAQRTWWNVRDADATLVLYHGRVAGGTALTARFARTIGRPLKLADLSRSPSVERTAAWMAGHRIRSLNVAGPRESQCPGIYLSTRNFLEELLSLLASDNFRA